jgi:hypothetical protein
MMVAWRRVLLGTLVMVPVSLRRRRSRSGGGGSGGGDDIPIFTMPRTRDLACPQQLRNQEKRRNKAGCATMEHAGV